LGRRYWLELKYVGHGYTMNKRQKACVWFGRICSAVGTILILIGVVWRWIFNIRGDSFIGSIPYKIFWLGAIAFFAGFCIIKISMPDCNNNEEN
jgi:drug/metabolite transporter superfamily protein YnfA